MMEENNRKGPGIFYAVVGVATLVVAIIGATFAFFTAQATTGEEDIKGGTLDLSGAALTMTAERYVFAGAEVTNKNLVPADLTADAAGLGRALTASCENAGYTGCHVYEITAGTTEDVTAATVTLDLEVTTDSGNNKNEWKYALFTATEAESGDALSEPALLKTVNKDATGSLEEKLTVDLNYDKTAHDAGTIGKSLGLTGGTDKVVYLMVYLENDDANAQNNPENTAENATGSYVGTVTLNAGADGGKVVASFAA